VLKYEYNYNWKGCGDMNLIPRNFYLDDFFDSLGTAKSNDMKCDIYEKDGNYNIEVDIPGFDKKDINIEAEGGYLTITAEKEDENSEENKKYIRRERSYGKYQRVFYLGEIDEDNIKAEFKQGMLKVVVPKLEKIETKKKIQIEE
jgi:HSP20 family protein